MDNRCPECGQRPETGQAMAEFIEWAENTISGLRFVATTQAIGIILGVVGFFIRQAGYRAGGLLVGGFVIFAGVISVVTSWSGYVLMVASYAVRRRSPAFRNLKAPTRETLKYWLVINSAFVGVPLLLVLVLVWVIASL